MKKISFTVIACLFILFANAQRIGIKAGVNFANANYEMEGASMSTDSRTGLHIGLMGDFPISESWSFEPNLLYSQKGFKMGITGIALAEVEATAAVDYIDIPANIVFKHDLGGPKLALKAGPYLGVGISAKVKSGDEEEDAEFGSGDDQIKRIDFGANFGAGIEIDAIQFGINYGLGFVNLENDSDYSMKNNVLSFSIGYFFGN